MTEIIELRTEIVSKQFVTGFIFEILLTCLQNERVYIDTAGVADYFSEFKFRKKCRINQTDIIAAIL